MALLPWIGTFLIVAALTGQLAERVPTRWIITTGLATMGAGLFMLSGLDGEIHRTVAAAARNRMAEALIAWVFEVVQPRLVEVLHRAVVHSVVIDQHEALVAAIEKGDHARAERAMKDHLLYLRDVPRLVQESDGRG